MCARVPTGERDFRFALIGVVDFRKPASVQ